MVIPSLDVYPNGFRINVQNLTNPRHAQEIQAMMHRPRMGMVRIGVCFADGRVAGRGLARGRNDLPKAVFRRDRARSDKGCSSPGNDVGGDWCGARSYTPSDLATSSLEKS